MFRRAPETLMAAAGGGPVNEHDLALARKAFGAILEQTGELPRLKARLVAEADGERAARAYLDQAADASAAVRRERGLSEPGVAVPVPMPVSERTLETTAGPVRVNEQSLYAQPGAVMFEPYSPVVPPHRAGGA